MRSRRQSGPNLWQLGLRKRRRIYRGHRERLRERLRDASSKRSGIERRGNPGLPHPQGNPGYGSYLPLWPFSMP